MFFWQLGHGSDAIFDVSATGAINFWLPVVIFAFLFGLSMDYEVFILARMREEYDRTGDTSQAVITGIGRTGRLVTSAALILFFAFAALASSPGTDIKVLGTALGVGILIDATIVRALLVPALVSLLRPVELVAARLARPSSCSSSRRHSPDSTSRGQSQTQRRSRRRRMSPAGRLAPPLKGTSYDQAHLATIRRVSCSSTTPSSSDELVGIDPDEHPRHAIPVLQVGRAENTRRALLLRAGQSVPAGATPRHGVRRQQTESEPHPSRRAAARNASRRDLDRALARHRSCGKCLSAARRPPADGARTTLVDRLHPFGPPAGCLRLLRVVASIANDRPICFKLQDGHHVPHLPGIVVRSLDDPDLPGPTTLRKVIEGGTGKASCIARMASRPRMRSPDCGIVIT